MTATETLEQAIRDARTLGLPNALIARLRDAIAALAVIDRARKEARR